MITTISRRNFLRFIGGAAGTAVVFSSVGASNPRIPLAQHDVAPRFGHWFSGAEQHLALKAWFDPILAFDLAQGMRLTSLLR
jgi:hypothetical protein